MVQDHDSASSASVSWLENALEPEAAGCRRAREAGSAIPIIVLTTRDSEIDESRLVSHGPLELHTDRLEARVAGESIDLTLTEFRLLRCFVASPGVAMSRSRLLRAMREDDSFVSERMVDSYVNRIRRKIEEQQPGFDALETVVGLGYKLRA